MSRRHLRAPSAVAVVDGNTLVPWAEAFLFERNGDGLRLARQHGNILRVPGAKEGITAQNDGELDGPRCKVDALNRRLTIQANVEILAVARNSQPDRVDTDLNRRFLRSV